MHNDKVAGLNDAHRKTQEDFFIKYFTCHFICKVSKRVTQSLRERDLETEHYWNILTPKLWPSALCLSRSPWLLNRSTGFPYYNSSISVANYTACPQLYSPLSTGSLNSTDWNSTVLCSIRRPYITFKLLRGDMDTPPQLLPISSDRDVSLPLSLEWPVWSSSSGNNCHPVQRSLSSGSSVYESIMGFFFTSSHFISQFPPTRFPLITAIRMCHFLPVHYLEWHFWPGQQVKT